MGRHPKPIPLGELHKPAKRLITLKGSVWVDLDRLALVNGRSRSAMLRSLIESAICPPALLYCQVCALECHPCSEEPPDCYMVSFGALASEPPLWGLVCRSCSRLAAHRLPVDLNRLGQSVTPELAP